MMPATGVTTAIGAVMALVLCLGTAKHPDAIELQVKVA